MIENWYVICDLKWQMNNLQLAGIDNDIASRSRQL